MFVGRVKMMNNAEIMPMGYSAEEPQKAVFSRREMILSFAAVGLGYGFIKCFAAPFIIKGRMGLGAAALLIFTVIFGFCFKKGRKITPSKALRTVLCILFAANIFISANLLIQTLCFIFSAMIIVYDSIADTDGRFEKIRRLFPADMFTAVFRPFDEIGSCPAAIKSAAEKGSAGKTAANALLGLAIALPSTIIVGILLMSADSGFAEILSSFTDGGLRSVMIFAIQVIIGLPVGFYLFSMYRTHKNETVHSDDELKNMTSAFRFVPASAAAFSAVPLCVMYVIFFFSQASYFLSAFVSRLPADTESYSAYARQGFFQLCIVSVIDLAVIIGINLFSKVNEDGKKSGFLKAMTVTLCVFTVLLIITAVSKMGMYISVYGLTRLRFYTSWFMLLLGVLFIGIIISVACEKFNLSKFAVTAFTVMFAALSFSNADRLIAEYNIGRYLDGSLSSVDITMFSELSADAVPAAEKLYGHISSEEENALEDIVQRKISEANNADIRSITLSEIMADSSSSANQR